MSDSDDTELVVTETLREPKTSKKQRSPAQAAATQKAFAAMKARREQLSEAPPKEQKKKSEPVAPRASAEAPPAPAPEPVMPPTPPPNAMPNDITEFAKQIIMALRPTGPAEPIKMSKARKPRQAKAIKQPTAHEEAPSPKHTGIRESHREKPEPLVSLSQVSSRDLLMNNFKKPATAKGLTGTELLDKLFFSR